MALSFKTKRDTSPAGLSAAEGMLTLTNVNRNIAGQYRVKAKNSEGEVQHDFSIDVLCKLLLQTSLYSHL